MSTLSIPPSSMPPAFGAPASSFNTLNLDIDDGEPLDSIWHAKEITILMQSMEWHWRDREDKFIGGNCFVYFDPHQAKDRNFRGPDFLVVKDAPWRERGCWIVWEEGGRVPDLVVELMSPTTKHVDLTTKRDIYEKILRTPEYVAYDPATRELLAWRLKKGQYKPLKANDKGRIYLEQVDLWIGTAQCEVDGHEGCWLRFFDADGRMILTGKEGEAELKRMAEARADAEATLKRKETVRANREAIRADAEAAKAEALAREVAELKARLAKSDK